MLKRRLIAVIPVYNGIVVQSIGFNRYLPIGKPAIAVEFLNKWGVDEIVYVDITARKSNSSINFSEITALSDNCYIPLTVGGGINCIDDIEKLMQSGADKIALNHALLNNPNLITEVAKSYGDQCVVASIDAILTDRGYFAFDYLAGKPSEVLLSEAIKIAVDKGAGELFINTVHRDGLYSGYDVALFQTIQDIVNIPVLACGGARNSYHVLELLNNTRVSGACVGNFFNFHEHSVNKVKRFLVANGEDIRLETHADYLNSEMDFNDRLLKKSDTELEHLLYLKIEKEII